MKRLTKNLSNKMICGVCSGIADYFGIDPTIVRIGAVVLSICAGFGVLAYLLCAIVMPSA